MFRNVNIMFIFIGSIVMLSYSEPRIILSVQRNIPIRIPPYAFIVPSEARNEDVLFSRVDREMMIA